VSRAPTRPEGQVTRGKTAPNRLRRVDHFLLAYDPGLLRRADGPYRRAFFVDLGFGAEPTTTLESARRLRRLNPELPVLGVEIDPERVAAAAPHAGAGITFRHGGFDLPLGTWLDGSAETVRVVRACNVLRQYEAGDVEPAYERLCRSILPGGLLVEGTSDPFGSLWVANVVRCWPVAESAAPTWQIEALVFATNFRTGFDPAHFQPVLPKNLIHRVVPGQPIYDFFAAWKRAALETRALQVWGPRQWFVACAERLVQAGYRLNQRKKWLRRGYLIWQQPDLGEGGI
jgi:hypothetical protein